MFFFFLLLEEKKKKKEEGNGSIMRILLASPYPEEIRPLFTGNDDLICANDHPYLWPEADWVVCYGYRQIIKQDTIARYVGKVVNIHIACLPWNRGADPNFWSWVDNTPKGVSVHQIDSGIDTGPIYSKLIVHLHNKHTLRSSYEELRRLAVMHFAAVWPGIRDGGLVAIPQTFHGSYHRSSDKDKIFNKLLLGWDTPVSDLMG